MGVNINFNTHWWKLIITWTKCPIFVEWHFEMHCLTKISELRLKFNYNVLLAVWFKISGRQWSSKWLGTIKQQSSTTIINVIPDIWYVWCHKCLQAYSSHMLYSPDITMNPTKQFGVKLQDLYTITQSHIAVLHTVPCYQIPWQTWPKLRLCYM